MPSVLCELGRHEFVLPLHRLYPDEERRKFVLRCTRGCGAHVERFCDESTHASERHPDLPEPGGPGMTVTFTTEYRRARDAANDAVGGDHDA